MTEATALMLAESSGRKDGRQTPLEFVHSSVVAFPNTNVIVKQVSPHWFRVRFWREVSRPDLTIKDIEWVADRLYEVTESQGKYQLIDRTIRPKYLP